MMVLYLYHTGRQVELPLAELVANFDENGGWYLNYTEEEMRDTLGQRGWFQGLHEEDREESGP